MQQKLQIAVLIIVVLGIISVPQAQNNNNLVLFVSDRDGNREIYSMNPDGENWKQLTRDEAQDLQPRWSPDRSKIAFVSMRDNDLMNIYTMSVDGGNLRRLTTENSAHHEYPAWSPDGRYIAYVSDTTGNYEIYIMDADGSNPRRLTETEDYEYAPVWSPDGRSIVFQRELPSFANKIFTMNTDGSGQRQLIQDLENESDNFSSPVWSPDGQQLAFAVAYFFSNGSSVTEINVLDMQSSNATPRLLTSYNDTFVNTVSWSPDGASLVYDLDGNGNNVIGILGIEDSSTRIVTADDYYGAEPSWSSPESSAPVNLASSGETGEAAPDSNFNCPGTLPTRLVIGEVARVTYGGTANRLRTGAGTNNSQINSIPPGGNFVVLDGPECEDGYAWWQVDYDGQVGWTAEADDTEYWLERMRWGSSGNLELLTGGVGRVNGARMGPGEFQVEYYCPQLGYGGTTRDNTNWYCTRGRSAVYTLQQADYDRICRETYSNSNAVARRNGSGSIPAFRWRCYQTV
jgi:dipeptidyl aminopeptidase/acylaminoacyl peptidase